MAIVQMSLTLPRMRWLALLIVALSGTVVAGEPYPLWDGTESVAEYARKVDLPPTKTLDLGNGVELELVLIPAGKFMMGTPEPTPVDEAGFRKKIFTGQVLLALSGFVLLAILIGVLVRAIRKRRRPQLSLSLLALLTLAAGGCLLSGLHWRASARAYEKAEFEFETAAARYAAANPEEKPAHPVTLTKPFYMGKLPVTQGQYQQVTGKDNSKLPLHANFFTDGVRVAVTTQPTSKDLPVSKVNWYDTQSFCHKLEKRCTQTIRLPTEAEWEYACRAGTVTAYYAGDTDKDLDRVGWYTANSSGTSHPVGQKEPNAFKLYDMHGNMLEWCQDWYKKDYYAKSPAENPVGPAEGDLRVLRGSSWHSTPDGCRSAHRMEFYPDDRRNIIGFRVVVPADKTP